MAGRMSDLSIDAIRERFVAGGQPVSPHVLNRLKRDPRQGVRRIYELLKKRRAKEHEERMRLDGMLNFERVLWRSGLEHIAGVDEVGMGPLAGPVVAGAVVFPPGTELAGVDDSKRLDPEQREELAAAIRERASGIGIGHADVGEIDRLNIYAAGLLAMRRAIEALPVPPEHVLVDARVIPDLRCPQNAFNKGDGINFSIAAASIVAKTHRDRLMTELDAKYPEYGFARHKGYATSEHQEAIRRHGPCPIHRMSYGFIRELCGEYAASFYALKQQLESAEDAAALRCFEETLDRQRSGLDEPEHRKLRLMLLRRWKTV
jgi:ribonuclease HII